jgi:uncharacterized paraquat-inducible protein A
MNRLTLLLLHIFSLILLVFGLVKDMLHIEVNAHFIVSLNLFSEDRSVLGTLQTLWQTANYWPFLLIFVFGIIVPLVKSVIIFYLLTVQNANLKWYSFVNAISKWAMADVFAISIFVAFLGANAMENTKANLEAGFFFFAGYVLLSSIVAALLRKLIKMPETSNA